VFAEVQPFRLHGNKTKMSIEIRDLVN